MQESGLVAGESCIRFMGYMGCRTMKLLFGRILFGAFSNHLRQIYLNGEEATKSMNFAHQTMKKLFSLTLSVIYV